MRFGLMDTKVYAKEFTLKECAPGEMEICIENGSIDIDISHMVKDLCKTEREKVWEMAGKLFLSTDYVGMSYNEIEDCFGMKSITAVLKTPVDDALEKYEAWKKKHDAEAVIKSLKPQDVVYIKAHFCENFVGMVTRVNNSEHNIDILHTDGAVDTILFPEDVEHIEKIGRIVETKDILGDIAKTEKHWRNYSCGS